MSLDKMWMTYPTTLKDSDWTKHKGIVAKIFKNDTGIGAKLKLVQKSFDDIKVACFSDHVVDLSTKTTCEKFYQLAVAEFNTGVKKCCDQLRELKDLADRKKAEFEKHKLIPKASTANVKKISDEAQKLIDALRQFCIDVIAEIKEAKKKAPA